MNSELLAELTDLSHAGLRVGLCHGCFDLLHPGHISHFNYAKSCVDILVVSITSDEFVNKGPCRPVFPDSARLLMVSSLRSVDYSFITYSPNAVVLLGAFPFNVYFKGPDYLYSNHPGFQLELLSLSESTSVIYTPTEKHSSTDYIRRIASSFSAGK